ncbi:MAG TPA: methyltransferase domain-containing protein [Pirellulales bacterium]|nr:methyltransferase domain-containing protein [Pirellulales bacterium]
MTESSYPHADEVPDSLRAAERIVPFILAIVGGVRSVVDVGGGTGAWLSVFRRLGVEEMLLLDCPAAATNLLIDKSCFEPVDLGVRMPAPRRFDLAVCVEVAEHLPPCMARPLVEWLTTAADRVVFSAAIPGQGGKGHINLQPPAYWTELFERRGFIRRDVVRSKIVHDRDIPAWYRQNLFLFVEANAQLAADEEDFLPAEFDLV